MSLNPKMALVFPNWFYFLRYSILLFKNRQILTLVFSLFCNFDEVVSVFSSISLQCSFIFDVSQKDGSRYRIKPSICKSCLM